MARDGLRIVVHLDAKTAQPLPVNQVKAGDQFVVGTRVSGSYRWVMTGPPMHSSSWAPPLSIGEARATRARAESAQLMKETRESGQKIVAVSGTAVIHTGAGAAMANWWLTAGSTSIFGGNAIAVHDIESALYNTSLGINLSEGSPTERGHEHHLRAINRIRGCGGIKQAVDQGVLKSGLFYQIVKSDVPYVLAGLYP